MNKFNAETNLAEELPGEELEQATEAGEEKQETEMIMSIVPDSIEANKKLSNGMPKLQALIKQARGISGVSNQKEYEDAGALALRIKAEAKDIKNLRLFITRPIDQLKAYFMEKFDKPVKEAEETVAELDGKRSEYFQEQERKRRAEQERLDREAREKEEKERERLRKQAEKAAGKGNTEKAEELRQQAETVFVPAPQAQSVAAKGDKVSMEYTGQVVDFGKIPDKYKMLDERALLRDIAESEGTLVIPGYTYTGKPVVSTRLGGARKPWGFGRGK